MLSFRYLGWCVCALRFTTHIDLKPAVANEQPDKKKEEGTEAPTNGTSEWKNQNK